MIFFDVAKCSFPIGKVPFADVANAHQVLVENVMLFRVLFDFFRKIPPKVFINDSVYKVFATPFFHFLECSFPRGKLTFAMSRNGIRFD